MSAFVWRVRVSPLFSLLIIGSVATACALAIRFYVIEPEAIASACAIKSEGFRCLLREYTVAGFLHDAFGITALIAGVLATVARWRWLALLAIVSGIAGAVFYRFELSGVGLLLGALVWVARRTAAAKVLSEQRTGEQQA